MERQKPFFRYPHKSLDSLVWSVKQYWRQWGPALYRELVKSGELEKFARSRAETMDMVELLKSQGLDEWEAWRVAIIDHLEGGDPD